MHKKIKVVFVFAVLVVAVLVSVSLFLTKNPIDTNSNRALSLSYIQSAEPVRVPEGYYIRTKFDNKVPDAVILNPDVNGVYLNFYWENVSKESGVYDWGSFDENLLKIVNSGKFFKLGGAMQDRMPAWVKADLGVNSVSNPDGILTFTEFRKNGACPSGDKSIIFDIAPPWSVKYQNHVDQFLSDVASHIKTLKTSDGKDVYQFLTGVEFSYAQRDTAEERLNSQASIKNCSKTATSTDAPLMWKNAGYKTSKILSAHDKMVNKLSVLFPGVSILSSVVPKSFPDIRDNGQIVSRDSNDFIDIYNEIIDSDLNKYLSDPTKKIIYKWDSYDVDTDSKLVSYYQSQGGLGAGQPEEDNWGDNLVKICGSKCSDSITNKYKKIADLYASKGLLFMEGFGNNVSTMPDAASYMNSKLNIKPTNPDNLAGVYKNSSINLTWDKSTDNSGYVYYEVYEGQTLLGRTFGQSVSIVDVQENKNYAFKVIAKDLNKNASDFSNIYKIDTTVAPPEHILKFKSRKTNTENPSIIKGDPIQIQAEKVGTQIQQILESNDAIVLPLKTTSMKFGNMGTNIKMLEAFMLDFGFCSDLDCKMSGYFGDKLLIASKKFQTLNSLPVDGTLGKSSIKTINDIYKKKTGSSVDLFEHVVSY